MFKAIGLQTYIWNNNLRSILLLAGFPVLLTGMVFAFELFLLGTGNLPSSGGVGGDVGYAWRLLLGAMPLALVVSAVWFAIAYFFNQTIIDLAVGARKVERTDNPELYNLVENLCISRGMKTPTLRIIETDALNAFASGLQEGRFSITVTSGLLAMLDRDELEAVLGHELTHIINRDVRTMVIASVFAGIITLIAQILFRVLQFGGGRSRSREKGGGGGVLIVVALAIAAIGYVLALVIRMALSRSREYVADAGSVELTKNPDAMISALRKISGHAAMDAPESLQAMFIDNEEHGVMSLFATHPPISRRIAMLEQYAGGRDVAPPVAQPAAAAPAGPWGAKPKGPWG